MGIACHKESAKGAYIIKDYCEKSPRKGIVVIRGTAPISSLVQVLPSIKNDGPNVKIIAAVSIELFKNQSKEYQDLIISPTDWNDAMIITNTSLKNMNNWIKNQQVVKYSLSPDFDNRWRTGGSVDQIIKESKLDPLSILNARLTYFQTIEKKD